MKQTGFIAQEVEKAFPNWLGENKAGFKTLDIPQREMQALLVESIRTLKTENDELKTRVKALENDRSPRPASHDLVTGAGLFVLAAAMVFAATRRKPSTPTA